MSDDNKLPIIRLSKRDAEAMADHYLNPREPNEVCKEAARLYKARVRPATDDEAQQAFNAILRRHFPPVPAPRGLVRRVVDAVLKRGRR